MPAPRVSPRIDILIPVFNEEQNLPKLFERIDKVLRAHKLAYNIISIDDHSSDGSVQVLSQLKKLYPVEVHAKKGKPGKAFSLLEAAEYAQGEALCMIDADLQYPPEVIPEMYQGLQEHGVIVARRVSYDGSLLRKIGSRGLAFLFGRMLLGIDTDVQSGLKVFRKSILTQVDKKQVTPWSLDLPLLHAALDLGFSIGEVEIDFAKRTAGKSNLKILGSMLQIGKGAVQLKLKKPNIYHLPADNEGSMIGAGVIHKRQRFITHTTLTPSHSALTTFSDWQRLFLFFLLSAILIGIFFNLLLTAQIIVGILSFIYFVDVVFNFFLIMKSLHSPPEIAASKKELDALGENEKSLPMYTVLCPLYKEAHVLPQFLEAISLLDWPKEKLDVILLFEEDDSESIAAVNHMRLPSYVRVEIVPDSQPKTKPKACNYGLNLAKGEYVVIFDAEDVPDPLQLKKAYLGFQKVGPRVKCLQAKLNYYNPHQNWLTRFFTAEYSLWFDVILTGLQSIETTIPLGGTSNHFRTKDLMQIQGWDPFNVTEDCDLGVRLFKLGYKTAIIDSTTLEEANSNVKNWIRQRSRWIKGYMQTYLLHMRNPSEFAKEQGIHALFFQLTVGGKLAFILINPLLWLLTISYFALYQYVGPTIETLYPPLIFYMAASSLVFGNFMFIYYYMIGCAKREQWALIKWVYLIPLYWLMVSCAGLLALYQLLVKPHYWEKTIHGLHLKKEKG
jgi:cellulose synthase/poly-beta-1,6-N-acetylglucosamine synthase-like glycosyltransferase